MLGSRKVRVHCSMEEKKLLDRQVAHGMPISGSVSRRREDRLADVP